MLTRIVVVGVLVFAALVAVKDGRVLRAAGLTSSCRVFANVTGGARLEVCRPGRLEGLPNLSAAGCTSAGLSGPAEYWSCPPGR